MDSSQPESESARKMCEPTTTITAEETASNSPAFLVVGADSGTNQMVLLGNQPVPASDNAFHRIQGNLASLAHSTTVQATNQDSSLTDQDLFRHLHDNTAEEVPIISHIGVFVNGNDEPHGKHQNVTQEPGLVQYQNGDLDSPLVPQAECGTWSQQAFVGGAIGKPPQDEAVSYSQECTEDVDSCCSYQLGKHWEKGSLVGRGVAGTCYVANDRVTKQRMVVKQLSIDSPDAAASEVELMQGLRHRNIVQFFGATRDGRHVNLFMELMEGGSLEDRLKSGAFEEDTICDYSRQLVSGLHYLHQKGVVHRDIKGGNILTDLTGKILKISDFGTAAKLVDGHKFHLMAGTAPFMAPEVVRANKAQSYGAKCDVWSVGCVVIEMATTRPPWVQENCRIRRHQIIYKIGLSSAPPPLPRFHREDLRDFAIQCLRLNPDERPTSEDLMNHRVMS